jgi:hypothetical protein
MVAWIRVHILNTEPDPDPKSVETAKMKEKIQPNGRLGKKVPKTIQLE